MKASKIKFYGNPFSGSRAARNFKCIVSDSYSPITLFVGSQWPLKISVRTVTWRSPKGRGLYGSVLIVNVIKEEKWECLLGSLDTRHFRLRRVM
jgi:hypothetical protein